MKHTQARHVNLPRTLGSGLIEVMLLIVIMGLGMLSMSKLHTVLLKDGGTASNRALAVSLAQEKIDDLRSFKWANETDATTAGETCGAGIFCFTEIAGSAGGSENSDGSLRYPSGTISSTLLPNTKATFSRTWTLDAGCTGNGGNLRCVNVTVSWIDPNGDQSVTLKTAIYPTDVSLARLGIGVPGGNKPGPKIIHNPGANPDVVPIFVTGQIKREAAKPEPDITQHALSTVTTFTTVNYDKTTNETISQEDYSTVNCTCTQSGEVSGTKGRTPSIGIGAIGEEVQKRTGIKKTGGQYGEQPVLCDICCKDHHDNNPAPRLYDPLRPTADYTTSGVHKHYLNLTAADGVGSDYDEACRLKRINGLWYVMPDWHLAALVVVPKSYLDNNLAAYQTAVAEFVKAYITALYAGTTPPTGPTLSPAPPTEVNIGSTTASAPEILMARGIYIDTMSTGELAAAKEKVDAGNLTGVAFQEVNVTRLAEWSSSNTPAATVTSAALTNATETTYNRGQVVKTSAGGSSVITATIKRSNTGLTVSRPIDPDDDATLTGMVTVSSTGGTPTLNKYVWGRFAFPTGSLVSNSDLTIPPSQGSLSCTKLTKSQTVPGTTNTCGVNDGCYSCSTNVDAWADTVKVEVKTTNIRYNTDYCVSPLPTTYSTTSTIDGRKTIYTTLFNFSGTLSGRSAQQIDLSFGVCP